MTTVKRAYSLEFANIKMAECRKMFERTNKLWKLLAIALVELRLREKSKNYKIDMYSWVAKNSDYGDVCRVCLAGSVVAGFYQKHIEECTQGSMSYFALEPEDFSGIDEVSNKMEALNQLRCGRVTQACAYLNVVYNHDVTDSLQRPMTSYYEDTKDQWWKEIIQLCKDLKKANI